jgi:hypothetical protein
LTLSVESASAERVQLRVDGFARLSDNPDLSKATIKGDFRLLGWLNYDAKKKAFDRFEIVALGDYSNTDLKATDLEIFARKQSFTLAVSFELAAPDSVGYGTEPLALLGADSKGRMEDKHGFIQKYFGTNPYRRTK